MVVYCNVARWQAKQVKWWGIVFISYLQLKKDIGIIFYYSEPKLPLYGKGITSYSTIHILSETMLSLNVCAHTHTGTGSA